MTNANPVLKDLQRNVSEDQYLTVRVPFRDEKKQARQVSLEGTRCVVRSHLKPPAYKSFVCFPVFLKG